MDRIAFEWDFAKDSKNLQKHDVTFAEAGTVFADALSITIPDPDHTTAEERIRLISAREATKHERRNYEENTL